MRQELVQPLKTLNPAKTCLYMLILLLLCTLLQAQTQDSPNDAGGAFDTYKEAKMSIYKKDWPHAEELLKGFDTRFPRSKYLDDSIYWLAYSRNQLSKDNRDISRAVALKKEAIAAVTLLLETCKESSWADDAIILRLNISADLVTLGAKEYKAYILATLETANESETDILVVALGALARIDARASVSFFDTILKQTKNAALREKIVFVLRNSNNEQLNAL
ncbi:MAG: hypothetical protein GY765_25585, partial [bacterium]|nr:hypothetical protein [bacterium]